MSNTTNAVLSAVLAGLAALIVYVLIDGGFSGTAIAVGVVAAVAAGGTRWWINRRSV
ncbi:MAG: hypothetical protein AAGF73_05500 [Actinomycetota bacterium]